MSDQETKAAPVTVKWMAVLWYIHLHFLGTYGIVLLLFYSKWMTVFYTFVLTSVACLGVTVGAHRLWAHRTFTATAPIKFFLMLAHTLACVGPIYDWVLAHRIHHKFYGTDKDPYNHNKGFLYSHYISNCVTKHPDYEEIKKEIDMRDMEEDGYVWTQKQFYWVLLVVVGLLLPINAPIEYWNESLATTVCVLGFLRLAITMNVAWLVNSAMLVWGAKEGDNIPADDNSVFFVNKTHWPAYHYMVPWDWMSGEFGNYGNGCSTFFIKMWHELGFVKQLQTVSSEDIREALYKVACKQSSMKESLDVLRKQTDLHARKTKLCHK